MRHPWVAEAALEGPLPTAMAWEVQLELASKLVALALVLSSVAATALGQLKMGFAFARFAVDAARGECPEGSGP